MYRLKSVSKTLMINKKNTNLFLDKACDPNYEKPNLLEFIEICDLINNGNSTLSYKAAIAVVKLVNSSNERKAEFALILLDILVKNCGYSFQLQIAQKEFLNKFVRKFTYGSGSQYSRVQMMILSLIEKWYQTICKTSRFKDDFKNIKKVKEILLKKGFVFTETSFEDIIVITLNDGLKSSSELQKEKEIVYGVKLQDLIRKGTPNDLVEANALMKIMSGYIKDELHDELREIEKDLTYLRDDIINLDSKIHLLMNNNKTNEDQKNELEYLTLKVKNSYSALVKIEEETKNKNLLDKISIIKSMSNLIIRKYVLFKVSNFKEAKEIDILKLDYYYNKKMIDFDNDSFNDNKSDIFVQDLISVNSKLSLNENSMIQNNLNSEFNEIKKKTFSQLQNNDKIQKKTLSININDFKSLIILKETSIFKFEIGILNDSVQELYHGQFFISNKLSNMLENIEMFFAVTKNCELEFEGDSNNSVDRYEKYAIRQKFRIKNELKEPLKIKWKINLLFRGKNYTFNDTIKISD